MIKGLKVRLTAEELGCHLHRRAAFHKERGNELASDIPKIQDMIDRHKKGLPYEAEDITRMSKYSNYNSSRGLEHVIQEMQSDLRNRRNRALAYEYMASHLFNERVYMLDVDDLQMLEIVHRW